VEAHRVLVLESTGAITSRVTPGLERGFEVQRLAPHAKLTDVIRRTSPALVLIELVEVTPELVRAVEAVMAECPARLLFLAETPELVHAANELRLVGALDALLLPKAEAKDALAQLVHTLVASVRVPVLHHSKGRRRRTSSKVGVARYGSPVVAIASSLGGPKALEILLRAIPKGFNAPVLICQHITPGFSDDLARWLSAETGLVVREGSDGLSLVKGEIVVAPAHVHMRVTPAGVIELDDAAPVGGFRPSCDVLLSSVAQAAGTRAVGVILTGMGADGARGLLEIRLRGGHTIAQDQKSCVVFGMPKEAIALGGAEVVLPLDEIAGQLVRWIR
jgi:two-component system chemotaxis response regulator CheB